MPFIGGVIFNFIGGCIRYLYGTLWRTIFRKKKYHFREYLNGPENTDDPFAAIDHQFVNRIVGFIALMLTCALIIKLGI
jgi:hypothetical protein